MGERFSAATLSSMYFRIYSYAFFSEHPSIASALYIQRYAGKNRPGKRFHLACRFVPFVCNQRAERSLLYVEQRVSSALAEFFEQKRPYLLLPFDFHRHNIPLHFAFFSDATVISSRLRKRIHYSLYTPAGQKASSAPPLWETPLFFPRPAREIQTVSCLLFAAVRFRHSTFVQPCVSGRRPY